MSKGSLMRPENSWQHLLLRVTLELRAQIRRLKTSHGSPWQHPCTQRLVMSWAAESLWGFDIIGLDVSKVGSSAEVCGPISSKLHMYEITKPYICSSTQTRNFPVKEDKFHIITNFSEKTTCWVLVSQQRVSMVIWKRNWNISVLSNYTMQEARFSRSVSTETHGNGPNALWRLTRSVTVASKEICKNAQGYISHFFPFWKI